MRYTATALSVLLTSVLIACQSESPEQGADGYPPEKKQAPVDITAPAAATGDVSPPASGFASDAWVQSGDTPWAAERERREAQMRDYIADSDPARAAKYQFKSGHTPALAWNWFDQHPVGFGGVPYVLLQTLLSLDPATETNPHLKPLANIWKKESPVASEKGKNVYTVDHLGFGPHPDDYENGVAKAPEERSHLLPNGFVYDPDVAPESVKLVNTRLKLMRDGALGTVVKEVAELFGKDYDPSIGKLLVLARGNLRKRLYGDEIDYEKEHDKFQQPPKTDAVFFACSGCHQGRVIVGGKMDAEGNVVTEGKMKFLPGMPNTEVEAQYFSRLLLETGLALVESGFSLDAKQLPDPDAIEANKKVVTALYTRLLSRAIDPEIVKTIYGPSKDQVRRAKLQTYWVAKDFPTHLSDFIGTAVKTQYIYYQIARKYAYANDNPRKASPDQAVPDVIAERIGQMDAFGIASGLPAIHTLRPDNSFIKFLYQDNPKNPLFTGLPETPGFESPIGPEEAGKRIRDRLADWVPPVPAPIDIKSLNWSGHRQLANWDGNQGASARALASGTSATGDPRKVNVRIHEPLNPFINNLPPPPYPFAVDREKAQRGMAIFNGEHLQPNETCTGCHRPNNAKIYPARALGVDENRAMVNTDVSRYALAGLVMEACKIFIRNNPDNDWCLPRDENGKVVTDWETANDDYFKDTPGRVRAGKHGYKADMLHGIWAQAPYLHNGSVPTLAQLLCPDTRPETFYRGILYYDEDLVGFEWNVVPRQRYSANDVFLVKSYDTNVFSRSNTGHTFGSSLCPDTAGLDPTGDRLEIEARITQSKIGDLLEYLKTL